MSAEFSPGDWVVYLPGVAQGNPLHPDCERGVVTALSPEHVFVRYGAELTSKSTAPDDLITADEYFAAIAASRQDRRPRSKGYRAYLGDGLYADFDGFQIVLSAENGIRAHDTVYLDERVLESFLRWHATKIAPLYRKQQG